MAIRNRLRRLERSAEPQGGRVIVVSVPDGFGDGEADAFLDGRGVERRPADLVVLVRSRLASPGEPADAPALVMIRDR